MKKRLEKCIRQTLSDVFNIEPETLEIQKTRKEFTGDYTLVVFPLVRAFKKAPEQVGQSIGEALLERKEIKGFSTVKGFLNLELSTSFFTEFLTTYTPSLPLAATGKTQMVEYSSPNTNKPLHLGHVRNNLLGYSVAQILKATGNKVIKTQIINDRGIHICKSMLAWQKFGEGETPESTGIKGDKLAGKYYVKFDQEYRKEIQELLDNGKTEEEAKQQAPLFLAAQEMLRKWEANDEEVRELWAKMNAWVYAGFASTYKRLGVDFDEVLYESSTYLFGKDLIEDGLEKGIFFAKEDGSVWIDLSAEGLDEKLVLRSDGTSVYMTQDLGTAVQRFQNHTLDGLTYVVGNEQDYHFKVLFLILSKLGFDWAAEMHHLSYGMVDLPHGKMKSREGTVVDADDLMENMQQTAKEMAAESTKLAELSEEEKEVLFEQIGMGALKYYLLKVDPKKRILFDPKESIDFNGNTGPFLQYAFVRIQSLLAKADTTIETQTLPLDLEWEAIEKEILIAISEFYETLTKAAKELSPALVANYLYDLVKLFNSFYQNHSILKAEEATKQKRLLLSKKVAQTLGLGLGLLGIEKPKRM